MHTVYADTCTAYSTVIRCISVGVCYNVVYYAYMECEMCLYVSQFVTMCKFRCVLLLALISDSTHRN